MIPTLVANAPEGLAALRAAQANGGPFALVLSDVQMPDVDGFTMAAAIKNDPVIASVTVVMLTSACQPGDAARCRELGVAAYLTKPIRRAELRSAILLALGRQSAEEDAPAVVTRQFLRGAHRSARILLVEDNQINQFLARRLLEKHGHTVVVTSNGREALAALDDGRVPGSIVCSWTSRCRTWMVSSARPSCARENRPLEFVSRSSP